MDRIGECKSCIYKYKLEIAAGGEAWRGRRDFGADCKMKMPSSTDHQGIATSTSKIEACYLFMARSALGLLYALWCHCIHESDSPKGTKNSSKEPRFETNAILVNKTGTTAY